MSDESTVLLEMYKIQVSRSEHYETLRTSVTNIVITLAAALVALATYDRQLSCADASIGAGVILLGCFGLAASHSHGKRSARHGKRAEQYRNELDRLIPNAGLNILRKAVPAEKTRLNHLWSVVHLAVMIIGLTIIVLALLGWGDHAARTMNSLRSAPECAGS